MYASKQHDPACSSDDVLSLMDAIIAMYPFDELPHVRRIYFNNRHTTIEWEDGEKTTVGCIEGQEFDEYAGFGAAVLKRLFGSSRSAIRYMNEHKVVQPEQTKKNKKAKEAVIENA